MTIARWGLNLGVSLGLAWALASGRVWAQVPPTDLAAPPAAPGQVPPVASPPPGNPATSPGSASPGVPASGGPDRSAPGTSLPPAAELALMRSINQAVNQQLSQTVLLLYGAIGLLVLAPGVALVILAVGRRSIVRAATEDLRRELLEKAGQRFTADIERIRELSLDQFRQQQQMLLKELYGELEELRVAIGQQQQRLAVQEAADPDLWYARGNDLTELGRDEEAVAAYDEALQLQPDFFAAWLNRGVALDRLGRYPEAIASFERALRLKPDAASLWYNRGTVLGKLGRYGEAVVSFERTLRLKANDAEAWSNRGTALVQLARYSEAIASFDRAIKLAPEFAGAWYGRASCYAVQNQPELAIEHLHKAIELGGDRFRDLARTDPEFDGVRSSDLFQWLLVGE